MIKYFIPFLFFVSFLCKGQVTTAQLDSSIKAGVDPYFIDSQDTVSKFGPDCITRDIIQDKNGNFWFASWHGIMKYDGRNFTNYTLKAGLKRFHIRSLFEDKKGNIWFGTARGGLYKYDGKTFTLFTTNDGLANNTVACITEDADGGMWFGTEGGGVSRYDGKKFTTISTKDGLCGNTVNSIIQDKNGKIWIGTMEGTCCYNPRSESPADPNNLYASFKDGKGEPIKKVNSIFEDKKGNIWIGTFDGVVKYNPSLAQSGARAYETFLLNFLTYYFAEDSSGNIWFTQSKPNPNHNELPGQVLYRYDGKNISTVLEKFEPGDFQIFGKMFDKEGKLWFGTMKGPCRYDPESSNDGKSFYYFNE
jgi:ligand-binding sensor domain-containing protein